MLTIQSFRNLYSTTILHSFNGSAKRHPDFGTVKARERAFLGADSIPLEGRFTVVPTTENARFFIATVRGNEAKSTPSQQNGGMWLPEFPTHVDRGQVGKLGMKAHLKLSHQRIKSVFNTLADRSLQPVA